ncbi:glucosidase [Acidithiobacillus ferrooxidans]|uniref:Glucosidase n=8 Tax=Acidithiobacillus TaxID=119977 RepID=A0A179BPX1_ACIFR|nr:hypothetical protein [Acidithiobacillus ferrooxidans]OAP93034.1 glucosidase [Acidithiobacillus ferrooxidans]
MNPEQVMNAERQRLEAQRQGREDWRLWGPYLAERSWGTVREDYSGEGTPWEYFDHDQARSRAYRWNEDGMGGICDEQQRLCFSLGLWNGRDPILKERAFGLTGKQGNHGEDVKEYYFYLDAAPSHAWLRYLYKYPQTEYPYTRLIHENVHRTRHDPPFSLLDTGAFQGDRYWDVEVRYAKASPTEIHIQIIAHNRGPEAATLHLLPTLWFRNTWSWGGGEEKPTLYEVVAPDGAIWAVRARHPTLGEYFLYGKDHAQPLYTENESNRKLLWNQPNVTPYVKDAFHRYVIHGETRAVNPAQTGTKFTAWHQLTVNPGQGITLGFVLSQEPLDTPFDHQEAIFTTRQQETDLFYDELVPEVSAEDHNILRQAQAGMIWNKQFYHYDVARWLDGDQVPPHGGHKRGRNSAWRHLKAHHIISVPDAWEYPWFAAWDLAYHCIAFAALDVDFAKGQIELLLKEYYLRPNGQIPACEWGFGDVNPPLAAMAAIEVFRVDRAQRDCPDTGFLQRVLSKLLMNYTWWLNRKDADGHNVFEGGFLGLDNISVYNRSEPLPLGYSLKQADATGWMAMFALNMTVIALELNAEGADYEDVAIQCYQQFLGIANTMAGYSGTGGFSLWDHEDGFFKDLVAAPDGSQQRIDVFSWVGIIPLFACEIVDQRLLKNAPRFNSVLTEHMGGLFDGHHICACPYHINERGEHLLSLADHTMLPYILWHLLSEDEFLSRYGIRSVSRIHAQRHDFGNIQGIGHAMIEYQPGESTSGLFGGNSNWCGPIWMPTNYTLICALEKYYRYLGDSYRVAVPGVGEMTLKEVALFLSERLVDIFRRNGQGRVPAMPEDSPFQYAPAWCDLLLFNEYFHGETGLGLGAMHQTGWSGLVANLIQRSYRSGSGGSHEGR